VQHAMNIVEAIKTAKPKRVVISTSGIIIDQPGTLLQASKDSAIAILLRGVEETGVSHAVVAPRLYLENLLLPTVFEPVKAEGVLRYPLRADFPVSWSSHLDVAEVAERLLTDTSVTGVVGVGGPVSRGDRTCRMSAGPPLLTRRRLCLDEIDTHNRHRDEQGATENGNGKTDACWDRVRVEMRLFDHDSLPCWAGGNATGFQ